MKYKKINDFEIAVQTRLSDDYGTIHLATVYDFLNMWVYTLSKNGSHNSISITSPQNFSALDSLEGVKRAYEELKKQDGTPPEINFPDELSSRKSVPRPVRTLNISAPRR